MYHFTLNSGIFMTDNELLRSVSKASEALIEPSLHIALHNNKAH